MQLHSCIDLCTETQEFIRYNGVVLFNVDQEMGKMVVQMKQEGIMMSTEHISDYPHSIVLTWALSLAGDSLCLVARTRPAPVKWSRVTTGASTSLPSLAAPTVTFRPLPPCRPSPVYWKYKEYTINILRKIIL